MQKPHRLSDLTGYSLKAVDGEIGKLEQIYFDDRHWIVRYFIVRCGNWLFGRSVLIVPAVIGQVDEQTRTLDVELSREQIQNSPPVDRETPVSKHYEQEYYRYYGWEPYWTGDSMLEPGEPYILPSLEVSPEPPEDPHLRSSDEVKHYSIHAREGDVGQVKDIILEEPEWVVRYLEVDTGNWLPGKRILLEPSWIEQITWDKQEVTVDLSRDAIETAPPYDPSRVIDREYQVELYKHYGKQPNKD